MTRRLDHFGFTMIEILAALIILVIFFAIAERLFNSTVLLSAAGENLSDSSSRIDSALFQLRGDVWNAKSIATSGSGEVELVLADGRQISWRIGSEQGVERTGQGISAERWEGIGKDWALSSDGFSLTIADKSGAPTRLVSQILLAPRMQS